MAKAAAKPKPGVTVRMYGQGLGDCFLLSFPTAGRAKKRVYVMIDCGVIIGTPIAAAKMDQVLADVAATVTKTNGAPEIDLLIVTHEHWDHVSGFVQAPDWFDTQQAGAIAFKDVWLAWTETSPHPVADVIRADQERKKKKVRAALAKAVAGLPAGDPDLAGPRKDAEAALGVLGFFGPEWTDAAGAAGDKARQSAFAAAGMPAAAGRTASTEAAMGWLKARATKFCKPGQRFDLAGSPGVEVFVLGPPEDLKALRRDAPRKGKDEAYEVAAGDRLGLLGVLDAVADGDANLADSPFDDRYRVSAADARTDPFFREFYGFPDDPLGDAGAAWRRIEYEWVTGAAQLALKMDSDTNNTSLALAFALPTGDTLVFPGDAQIGNWQSWGTVAFPKAGGKAEVTGLDLLRRAVFYKVGHHGSHNATLKAGGLDEMTGGDLVAMIPVDEAMAKTKRPPKTGWKMPWGPMVVKLRELTHHRILRADEDTAALAAAEQAAGPAGAKLWAEFRPQVEYATEKLVQDKDEAKAGPARPLYVQYTVPLEG